MPGIFISYRRDDSAYIAAAINEKFQQRFGDENVFFDIDTIPLGVDFRDHIGGAVGGCDVLLVVIGDQWVNARDKEGQQRLHQSTDYVRVEIESALQRDVPVVPILVGNALMPTEAELPESIRALAFRNAAEVRAGRDLGEHLERLVRDVGKVAGIAPSMPASRDSAGDAGIHSGDSGKTASPTTAHRSTKSRAPMMVGIVVILAVVGVVIAIATGMFNSKPETEQAAGTRDSDSTKDQSVTKDQPKDQIASNKDSAKGNGSVDTGKKDLTQAVVDGHPIKAQPKTETGNAGKETASKDAVGKGTTGKAEPTPGEVDRSDAKATAMAVLTAFKAKDFQTLSTLVPESKRKEYAAMAAMTEKHPRYASVFQGWRGDALKTWTGQLEAPRYEARPSDAGRIKAIVRFEQSSLTPLVAVAMYFNDGQWEFEDFESPPEVVYKRMTTVRPK